MQIFFEFESHQALIKEFEDNLSKARAFIQGEWDVSERQKVDLVLIHPVSGEWMPLAAEVVYIAPPGAPALGLEMSDWGPEKAGLVQKFVNVPETNPLSLVSPDSLEAERFQMGEGTPYVTSATASEARMAIESGPVPLQLSVPSPAAPAAGDVAPSPHTAPGVAPPHIPPDPAFFSPPLAVETPEEALPDSMEASSPPDSPEESEPPTDALPDEAASESKPKPLLSPSSIPPPKNVQERVRKLKMRERDAMARTGTLTERVALERAYGAAVWDALLSNNALTGPEVARIAKNGNATIPHLKQIVGNPAWLSKGEVRRALLTNPRLLPQMIERILRALPPNELKKLPKQTAYSPKVRAVAARLLPRS